MPLVDDKGGYVKFRAFAVFCLLAASLSRPAFAQSAVGAGLQAGIGCQQGRDDCAGRFFAPLLSVDLSDRFVARIRGFVFKISDRTVVTQGVSINESNITRRMVLGEFIARFRAGRSARPIIGVSLGSRRNSATITCTPGPCTSAFGAGAGSQYIDWSPKTTSSVGILAGFQFGLTESLNLETSVGLHDPFRENGGTAEAGVLLTLRLWKSR